MKPPTKTLTAHIPTSKKTGSPSRISKEEYYKLTMAALKEVKSGNVVDQSEVENWALGLDKAV